MVGIFNKIIKYLTFVNMDNYINVLYSKKSVYKYKMPVSAALYWVHMSLCQPETLIYYH